MLVALTMKGQSTGEQYYQACRSANTLYLASFCSTMYRGFFSISLHKSLEKCWLVSFLFIIIPLVKYIQVQLARGRVGKLISKAQDVYES